MDQSQYYILDNIEDFLSDLRNTNKDLGKFYAEADTFFLEDVHRRPDSAYFTNEQRILMSNKAQQVPKFVIEIISTKDQINLVHKKMQNYRDAGVEVI
jgi:Uma2 family endonuclease